MERLAIITVTKKGIEKALLIKSKIKADIYALEKYSIEGAIPMMNGFRACVVETFDRYDTILFIMASGIVVRTIAPLIKSKDIDPGILVMDENSNFVSSLLSGHLGGANEAAEKIADIIDAVPVISTASDVSGKVAVDTISMKIGGRLKDLESAKRVTSLIVAGEKVDIKVPQNIDSDNPKGIVVVSNRKNIEISQIIPKNIVVGIGCRRDTPKYTIKKTVEDVFEGLSLHMACIRLLATVDVKADEGGLLEYSSELDKELVIIDRDKIKSIEDKFETSEFVRKTIGVGAVSGPVALLASGRKGKFLIEKYKQDGVTVSVYEEETNINGKDICSRDGTR